MRSGQEFDHDSAVLDPLDCLVTRVDAQLFANLLLNGELTALTYSIGHNVLTLQGRYATTKYASYVAAGPLGLFDAC